MKRDVSRIAAVCSLLLLAACGGGGGGGGSSGNGVGNQNPPPTVSTMVPRAPAVGAVLFTDATVLRPTRLDAKWAYNGEYKSSSTASAAKFTLTTTLSPGGSTGIVSKNVRSDGQSSTPYDLSVANGVVQNFTTTDLVGTGKPESVPLIELRSPVRQDDQYTSFERRYATSGIDVDRDGKPDAIEVAAYARVIGLEDLTLPNLPKLKTLRVDTWLLVRSTNSSNGLVSPVLESRYIQTWYAAGIGIVRQLATSPNAASVETDDIKLSYWDAVTTGLGKMPAFTPPVPANAEVWAGYNALQNINTSDHAHAFDDRALLFMKDARVNPTMSSTLVARLDLRGNILGTSLLPISWTATPAAHKNGVVFLDRISGDAQRLSITQVDANGALIGAAASATVDLGGTRVNTSGLTYRAAADGTTLWVLWKRFSYYNLPTQQVQVNELVLRPFSFDGTALAPEMLLEPTDVVSFDLAVSAGTALVSWLPDVVYSGRGYESKYATASLAGLGPVKIASTTNDALTPVRLENASLLMSNVVVPGLNEIGNAGGLLLDSNLQPLRSGTTLADEAIAGLPRHIRVRSNGNRLVAHGLLNNADAFSDDHAITVGWMDVGTSPLTKTPFNSFRITGREAGTAAISLVFSDRILVLHGASTLQATVIWLNGGTGNRP